MEMAPYLSFKGECEAAFAFYEKCFGGRREEMFRYAGSPIANEVGSDWSDKIMHGSVTVGDKLLMGADVAPERYEEPKGFSLSLHIKNVAEAERIFHELARNGRVVMPLEKTFWAERFGMVIDRFRIPWAINCEGSQAG
jgi:PhnB protein